ncbi:aminotransferase class I/II-fold pyridoxal phosphate-dependent enzyme [Aquibacillus rhizosphaerae]|uniref:Aminotransferase class I/II-fold pyridoxal phosphate-dependent enzyme n=1 Tax=Aquibacillus rhizosphaerae TaxID=3051431 RepID=A0ABT7L149_9BACI|nr:aminotransferase class I/II-fold pyridoxal phosphate-dependent enzyme [Aquibacillus sp. LR5S19]MDL4839089.1 aminotransferase class I/II-fold pyridoxal phosphate-dependent enzyme [Aquibacillus sp. LR5S19]
MNDKNKHAPLFEKLKSFSRLESMSFHVPGHKNGKIFTDLGKREYESILKLDITELSGLDDLHAPTGVIKESQQLAASWFGAEQTHFLVGGSTVGNLAMLLAVCAPGDQVIVQRNCHKSILNGLELSGARPIFVAPVFDEQINRYTAPTKAMINEALNAHPDAKAVVLTYPDYFGCTFDLEEIVHDVHQFNIPVLVDEAHGVHFSVGNMFPKTALEQGADIVVQSAHKMAPAMTMAAYLHVKSKLIPTDKVTGYLTMLQSSSPSYPIMASLDLARYYLEMINKDQLQLLNESVFEFRECLDNSIFWHVESNVFGVNDPLKVTIQMEKGINGLDVAKLFEHEKLFPELATYNQILFVLGLEPFEDWNWLNNAVQKINEQLKFETKHATIESKIDYFPDTIKGLIYSYEEMKNKKTMFLKWDDVFEHVAAEAIIPYPPGIPILVKGEVVTTQHLNIIKYLLLKGTSFQNVNINYGLNVFL